MQYEDIIGFPEIAYVQQPVEMYRSHIGHNLRRMNFVETDWSKLQIRKIQNTSGTDERSQDMCENEASASRSHSLQACLFRCSADGGAELDVIQGIDSTKSAFLILSKIWIPLYQLKFNQGSQMIIW